MNSVTNQVLWAVFEHIDDMVMVQGTDWLQPILDDDWNAEGMIMDISSHYVMGNYSEDLSWPSWVTLVVTPGIAEQIDWDTINEATLGRLQEAASNDWNFTGEALDRWVEWANAVDVL
jgi:hypothetical protein